MATQALVDITKLSPKFQDLYAKAKDFVEVHTFMHIFFVSNTRL